MRTPIISSQLNGSSLANASGAPVFALDHPAEIHSACANQNNPHTPPSTLQSVGYFRSFATSFLQSINRGALSVALLSGAFFFSNTQLNAANLTCSVLNSIVTAGSPSRGVTLRFELDQEYSEPQSFRLKLDKTSKATELDLPEFWVFHGEDESQKPIWEQKSPNDPITFSPGETELRVEIRTSFDDSAKADKPFSYTVQPITKGLKLDPGSEAPAGTLTINSNAILSNKECYTSKDGLSQVVLLTYTMDPLAQPVSCRFEIRGPNGNLRGQDFLDSFVFTTTQDSIEITNPDDVDDNPIDSDSYGALAAENGHDYSDMDPLPELGADVSSPVSLDLGEVTPQWMPYSLGTGIWIKNKLTATDSETLTLPMGSTSVTFAFRIPTYSNDFKVNPNTDDADYSLALRVVGGKLLNVPQAIRLKGDADGNLELDSPAQHDHSEGVLTYASEVDPDGLDSVEELDTSSGSESLPLLPAQMQAPDSVEELDTSSGSESLPLLPAQMQAPEFDQNNNNAQFTASTTANGMLNSRGAKSYKLSITLKGAHQNALLNSGFSILAIKGGKGIELMKFTSAHVKSKRPIKFFYETNSAWDTQHSFRLVIRSKRLDDARLWPWIYLMLSKGREWEFIAPGRQDRVDLDRKKKKWTSLMGINLQKKGAAYTLTFPSDKSTRFFINTAKRNGGLYAPRNTDPRNVWSCLYQHDGMNSQPKDRSTYAQILRGNASAWNRSYRWMSDWNQLSAAIRSLYVFNNRWRDGNKTNSKPGFGYAANDMVRRMNVEVGNVGERNRNLLTFNGRLKALEKALKYKNIARYINKYILNGQALHFGKASWTSNKNQISKGFAWQPKNKNFSYWVLKQTLDRAIQTIAYKTQPNAHKNIQLLLNLGSGLQRYCDVMFIWNEIYHKAFKNPTGTTPIEICENAFSSLDVNRSQIEALDDLLNQWLDFLRLARNTKCQYYIGDNKHLDFYWSEDMCWMASTYASGSARDYLIGDAKYRGVTITYGPDAFADFYARNMKQALDNGASLFQRARDRIISSQNAEHNRRVWELVSFICDVGGAIAGSVSTVTKVTLGARDLAKSTQDKWMTAYAKESAEVFAFGKGVGDIVKNVGSYPMYLIGPFRQKSGLKSVSWSNGLPKNFEKLQKDIDTSLGNYWDELIALMIKINEYSGENDEEMQWDPQSPSGKTGSFDPSDANYKKMVIRWRVWDAKNNKYGDFVKYGPTGKRKALEVKLQIECFKLGEYEDPDGNGRYDTSKKVWAHNYTTGYGHIENTDGWNYQRGFFDPWWPHLQWNSSPSSQAIADRKSIGIPGVLYVRLIDYHDRMALTYRKLSTAAPFVYKLEPL